jgi:hypothetical protein
MTRPRNPRAASKKIFSDSELNWKTIRLADAELGDASAPGYAGSRAQFVSLTEDVDGWDIEVIRGSSTGIGFQFCPVWPFALPFPDDFLHSIFFRILIVRDWSITTAQGYGAIGIADNDGDPSIAIARGPLYQSNATPEGGMLRGNSALKSGGTVDFDRVHGSFTPTSTRFGATTGQAINTSGENTGLLKGETNGNVITGSRKMLVGFGVESSTEVSAIDGKFKLQYATMRTMPKSSL